MLGSLTLFVNSTFSALLNCFIANGGYSTIYYEYDAYGWPWFFLQIAAIFIYQVSSRIKSRTAHYHQIAILICIGLGQSARAKDIDVRNLLALQT